MNVEVLDSTKIFILGLAKLGDQNLMFIFVMI